jgi:hypothetical protein
MKYLLGLLTKPRGLQMHPRNHEYGVLQGGIFQYYRQNDYGIWTPWGGTTDLP